MQPSGDFPRKDISPKDQKDILARAKEVYDAGQLSAADLMLNGFCAGCNNCGDHSFPSASSKCDCVLMVLGPLGCVTLL